MRLLREPFLFVLIVRYVPLLLCRYKSLSVCLMIVLIPSSTAKVETKTLTCPYLYYYFSCCDFGFENTHFKIANKIALPHIKQFTQIPEWVFTCVHMKSDTIGEIKVDLFGEFCIVSTTDICKVSDVVKTP